MITETKKGYKKPKLGWIPEDWKFTKLGNLGQFLKGKGIAKSEVIEDGIPCVRYGEIYTIHNDYIKAFTSFTTQESANQSTKLEYGDILFAGSGETLEDIGKSVAFVDGFEAYAGGDIIILRGHNQDPKFVGFLLNTDFVSRQTFQLGQGHSVVHIYSSGLKNVKIPLPPLPEQQKIANILSTWDKAIDKLTQLITAKEQRKKGLIQQLLIGKKRFAGFADEWKEVKLGEILTIGSGRDYKHLKEGTVPVYGTGGIMTFVNDFLFDGESVGIGRKGTIDKPQFLNGKFWTVDTLFYTHSFKNSVPKYIFYLFLTINWKRYNEASGVPSLSKNTIEKIKVRIPALEEQQKIASVLTAADKEVELLKSELERLQQQKKGLMQVLLTGEVRVNTKKN